MARLVAPVTNQTAAVDTKPDLDEGLAQDELPNLQQLKQRSVAGVVSYMLRTLFLQLLGLASFGVLAGLLEPAEIGIFGLVTQVLALLTFFSDVGLAAALIQKKTPPTLTEYRAAFTVQFLLSGLIFAICLIVAATNYLGSTTGQAGNALLLVLGFSFAVATFKTIPSVILERQLNFSRLVIPNMAEQIIYNALLILLAWQGFGIWSYGIAVFVRSLVGVVAMYLLQGWSIGFSLDRLAIKHLFGTGIKFQLNDFLARIKDNLFYIVLGRYFVTPTEFGYITVAKSYSQLPYTLTVQNVIAVTFPTYSRLQHHRELLQKAIEKTLFFVTLIIFPLLAGMTVLIGPLMTVIPAYQKWQPALWTFIFFTLSIGWAAISTPLTNTLNALGKLNTHLKLMLMWTTLTWVLTPLFYWWFGFTGIALAAFVISFTSILPVVIVKRLVPLHIGDQIWRQSLAAGLMLAVGWVLRDVWSQSLWHFLGGGVALSALYGVSMLVVGRYKVWGEVRSLLSRGAA